uniref:Putative secreted protein n=1 Tax=Anopheles darlingi TaxID=43151 RepID=A0A2M4D6M5_ANODA
MRIAGMILIFTSIVAHFSRVYFVYAYQLKFEATQQFLSHRIAGLLTVRQCTGKKEQIDIRNILPAKPLNNCYW